MHGGETPATKKEAILGDIHLLDIRLDLFDGGAAAGGAGAGAAAPSQAGDTPGAVPRHPR